MYQTCNTIILQAVSQANSFLCVCFFFVFFSWQPTIDLWLCSQHFKFQVQSLGLTCPHCHFTSDEIRSVCSNSVVNIRYIYTGCHINDFSVCTMPKDMRRAVVSSEGRKLFLYFTAVLNSWGTSDIISVKSFSNRIWIWFRLRLQIIILMII